MTLTTLLLYVGIAALVLLLGISFGYQKPKNWLISALQYFCGVLFLVSGWVKAVDPLGTAYKMEQYFTEFETTFSGTSFSFLAPLFPALSSISIVFSVFMIVLEIVLGIMLIIGISRKLTAWIFFGLVFFFTFLTGFTYLTGYVPQDVNFFSFSQWGPYIETNMKVTDCGCFGDFIKLKPYTSFLKDVFLLFPAILFLIFNRQMHELLDNKVVNWGVVGVSTLALTIYCMTNFVWDIPKNDFRPFKKGADVRSIKTAEEEAMASIKITHYVMKNKKTGETKKLAMQEYMNNYQNYPKDTWKVLDQIKTKPSIEPTKISDFSFTNGDGINMEEELLNNPNYSIMFVSYKLKMDDQSFLANYKDKVVPLATKAEAAGIKVFGVAGGAGQEKIENFRHEVQAAFPVYEADDILLKTIVRSNPGIVLWKDGKIVNKWHINKLPAFENLGIK